MAVSHCTASSRQAVLCIIEASNHHHMTMCIIEASPIHAKACAARARAWPAAWPACHATPFATPGRHAASLGARAAIRARRAGATACRTRLRRASKSAIRLRARRLPGPRPPGPASGSCLHVLMAARTWRQEPREVRPRRQQAKQARPRRASNGPAWCKLAARAASTMRPSRELLPRAAAESCPVRDLLLLTPALAPCSDARHHEGTAWPKSRWRPGNRPGSRGLLLISSPGGLVSEEVSSPGFG